MWCEGISACRKEENMSRYSVILLDDEELILQSLQTLIDWEKLGCYIVGTAKTGDKGKRLIERLHALLQRWQDDRSDCTLNLSPMFLQECAFFALVDNELHVMEGDRVKNHCLIVAPKEGVVTTL